MLFINVCGKNLKMFTDNVFHLRVVTAELFNL